MGMFLGTSFQLSRHTIKYQPLPLEHSFESTTVGFDLADQSPSRMRISVSELKMDIYSMHAWINLG